MQTTYEPMTARQKRELRGYVSWWIQPLRVVIYLAVIGFVTACLRSIHLAFGKPRQFFAWDIWWMVPSLTFAVWLYRKDKIWSGGRKGIQGMKADLAEGILAVHHIVVKDVIEIEEQEDEGPSFFILSSENKVIYFHGQELHGWKRRGFPWREFEIKESPHSKMLFRLQKSGEAFPPTFVRKPMSYEMMKLYSGNFDGRRYRILDEDFESLKTDPAKSSDGQKIC